MDFLAIGLGLTAFSLLVLIIIISRKNVQLKEGLILAEERARQVPTLQATLNQYHQEITHLKSQIVALDIHLKNEQKNSAEKIKLLEEAEDKILQTFKALSAEALAQNNHSFLTLAKESLEKFHEGARGDLVGRQKAISDLLTPVHETLKNVDQKIGELEKLRVGAYEGLKQQVSSLIETQKNLQAETANLVTALKAPSVRGRWGEMQLRRVVEMAGMLSHCDFQEQVSLKNEETHLRPDMVIHLPGEKNVVVDAKAPLGAYLEALEAKDPDVRLQKLKDHARQVRQHVQALSSRAYWEKFQPAPEFVILFLPGETFFSAALEQDPSLIEMGAEQKVILATPTTLIALLRAVAYGWRQEQLTENAKDISILGQSLYKRLGDLGKHINKMGRALGTAVDAYNQTVGTLEHRVFVTARKFQDLGAASHNVNLDPTEPLNRLTRHVQED